MAINSTASTYAYLFRQAADKLSALEPPPEFTPMADGSECYNPHHVDGPVVDQKLIEHCGRLVIEAVQRGLIVEAEIQAAVKWHTGSDENDPKPGTNGVQCVRCRCPGNLWHDVAGGHSVRARVIGSGRVELVKDPETGTSRTGGILPAAAPALLRLPANERYAAECEMLAELIERPATLPKPHDNEEPIGPFTRTRWAALLNCSERKVTTLAKNHKLPCSRKGAIYFPRNILPPDIDERISNGK